ncbi:MAG: mercury resistance system transport protein MerF [Flavobacteriaceae bacterium]|jgi:mercuric ion transport protein|nr:mercury resistance system transport protein MerF [Pelagibacteraceae bacterium]MBT5856887.1 mercury resistance system transport protein MerF [Flavobacteriaceae bacterium]MBT3901648.1 mercury resistance system transport protein MerF [Pelagibacteraceae bacterium]MBT4950511.1 mercury resistance system transport protein MerF [Pelagibacteraceae bacterium]MBT5213594.1 mercury resistance system transport protein MerF [Pelagibacteraceae bacterium]
MNKKILKIGIVGTLLTSLCCFTPFLIIILTFLGIASWLAWLDFILLPLLAFHVILIFYAIINFRKSHKSNL